MISGGIKFFAENPALIDNGGEIVSVTSGSVVEDNMLDKLPYTYWTSVASTDSTVETIIIQFSSQAITRILLLDHNWKQYTVKYWNGSAFVDFTSVVGLDAALVGGITETAFVDGSSYYEVASVTTSKIQITVTKTQVANAQKYIATVFPTTEIGTMSGYPIVSSVKFTRTPRTSTMLSGKVKIVKQPEAVAITVDFNNYPVLSYGADIDLINTLVALDTPFYIWLCGGRRGSNYFAYPTKGWILKDCYRVQIDSDLDGHWTDNLYKSGQNLGSIIFTEHV